MQKCYSGHDAIWRHSSSGRCTPVIRLQKVPAALHASYTSMANSRSGPQYTPLGALIIACRSEWEFSHGLKTPEQRQSAYILVVGHALPDCFMIVFQNCICCEQ